MAYILTNDDMLTADGRSIKKCFTKKVSEQMTCILTRSNEQMAGKA